MQAGIHVECLTNCSEMKLLGAAIWVHDMYLARLGGAVYD